MNYRYSHVVVGLGMYSDYDERYAASSLIVDAEAWIWLGASLVQKPAVTLQVRASIHVPETASSFVEFDGSLLLRAGCVIYMRYPAL